ncbi:hypothetical protein E8E11_003165 [Didymella keratinophila]|nr:hypothetical protein E8E11_003165 [Didymella keratinophila]
MNDYDEAVLFTFSLLESRLARLEYLLSGPTPHNESKPQPIPERIRSIEVSLTRLAGKTALLDNVHELLNKHKDVLSPKSSAEDVEDATPLSASQKSHLVLDRAPAISTTASQLSSLHDTSVPDTDGFIKLASLRPRIAEAEQRQLQQALKISELRRRSGLVVQRDRQVLQQAGGRAWVDGQERLVKGWRSLQREEGRRKEGREEEQD